MSRVSVRQAAAPGSNKSAAKVRILVVDDEPAIRRLLRDLLTGEGYAVTDATDGRHALHELQVFQPDMVIVDMTMPVMDGLEFVAACRQIEGCADLPIILLSAMYDIARMASSLPGAGVTACLGKPFSVNEILTQIELHAPRPSAERVLEQAPVRVLVVLDQPIVAGIASLTLNHGVYDTRTVTSSGEAVSALGEWQPHLMLLDMELARGGKIMLHVGVHKRGGEVLPVIGLTHRGDLGAKLAALDAGVDDILDLPFAPEELLTRVMAVLRRCNPGCVSFTPVLEIGELQIDILKRTASSATTELHLSSVEHALLYVLAASGGRVVSRKEIRNALWDHDSLVNSTAVERHVRNLRARLLNISGPHELIASVPGGGYRFLPALSSIAT